MKHKLSCTALRLLAVFVGLFASMSIEAQTTFTKDGFTFEVVDATNVKITSSTITSGNLVIPETVDYNGTVYIVTTIGENAFANDTLISVTLPKTVKYLKDKVFYNNFLLRTIIFADSLKELGTSCFDDCASLRSINIPSGIKCIPEYCFGGCTSLKSIVLPETVDSLGYGCFLGCHSLTSFTFPSKVTKIPPIAFSHCSKLASISIPLGITKIGQGAFYDSGLKSITIPASVTEFGEEWEALWATFGHCDSLRKVEFLGDQLRYLPSECFYECKNLEEVILSNGIRNIYEDCFRECTNLRRINLPTELITISANINDTDGYWYTLQGVRLTQRPTIQGVYIHNGKKVVIRNR